MKTRPTVELRRIDRSVVVNRFDCGRTPLDRFLKNKALRADRRDEDRVFVATEPGSSFCIAYYAMRLAAEPMPDDLDVLAPYLANYETFVSVHLSWLAVDAPFQRRGIGQYLLMDAFDRVTAISEHAGFAALTLQSFDAGSTAFYERIGFIRYGGGDQPKMLYPLDSVIEVVERIV